MFVNSIITITVYYIMSCALNRRFLFYTARDCLVNALYPNDVKVRILEKAPIIVYGIRTVQRRGGFWRQI